jgi:GNAT superfamily N-acetyltransferase
MSSENNPMIEWQRGEFRISTDKMSLDIDRIHAFLSQQAYWAIGRSYETIARSIANSLCFGIYDRDGQVGFARVVTDYATFAWLCDVFVMDSWRGQGLGKWLVECVVAHPDLTNLRRILLATRDAHELYRQSGGFSELKAPERWMERQPQP